MTESKGITICLTHTNEKAPITVNMLSEQHALGHHITVSKHFSGIRQNAKPGWKGLFSCKRTVLETQM